MMTSASWRSHRCGDLRAEDAGTLVTLCGWVNNRRDHGGVSFVDLRDRYGLIQLIGDEEASEKARAALLALHPEYVIQVKGVVRLRGENRNPDRPERYSGRQNCAEVKDRTDSRRTSPARYLWSCW